MDQCDSLRLFFNEKEVRGQEPFTSILISIRIDDFEQKGSCPLCTIFFIMITKHFLFLFMLSVSQLIPSSYSQSRVNVDQHDSKIHPLQNPISVDYLNKQLAKQSPRLVLNPAIETTLRAKLESDPVVKNMFAAFKLNANAISQEPLLKREKIGRRLLSVSREFLYRMNILAMVYRIEKDPNVLQRIDEEVRAICGFSDWNPSHFLDVAEMSLGLALAIDWAGEDLPTATVSLAKSALIEKGINPSFNPELRMSWINGTNNWNQVCHAGMIAAAIVIAEEDPSLAAKTIHRALQGMPHALVEYGPDGVYPEGSTYWRYGTSFSVITAAMFESAFGTDFGLGDYPSFKESATFRVLCNAPSEGYYNFADCGDSRSPDGDLTLAWFASKTGNRTFYEKERFLKNPTEMKKLERISGAALVWLSQVDHLTDEEMPQAWIGRGANPVAIFTSAPNDPAQFYLGAKGGRGMVNHGNMDGGSFILEMNGVRWVVDPGNQNYNALEKTGFNLWDRSQGSQRWTLLTKNNYGHSTLTVDNQLHRTEGMTTISNFKDGAFPEVSFDMTPSFGGQLKRAIRTFTKESSTSVLIKDEVEILENVDMITWQLMTTSDVELRPGGAILTNGDKQLQIELMSHPELSLSIISLDPPPLKLDRTIENLKRLELRIPTYLFDDNSAIIEVRLSGK